MSTASPRHDGGRPPNIVVVLADDMGWGDLGCYGSPIPTPHIDRLATEGVRAVDCHSASAVCTPSRYALMTGRYAWRGPLKSFVLMGHGPALIERDRPTLATTMKEAGYATGAFGKWHLGLGWRHNDGSVRSAFAPGAVLHDDVETDFGRDIDYTAPFVDGPLALGFDRFFGIAGSLDMPPYAFLDQDRTLGVPDHEKEVYLTEQRPGLQVDGWDEREVDRRFVDEACSWLRDRAAAEPFLCYLAMSAPHRPNVPPDEVRGRSGLGDRADGVCLVDWAVGRLLEALETRGELDETLVIVTSDNGAPTIFTDDGDCTSTPPTAHGAGRRATCGMAATVSRSWHGGLGASRPGPPSMLRSASPTSSRRRPKQPVSPFPTVGQRTGGPYWGCSSASRPGTRDRPLVHHSLGGRFALRAGRWKAVFAEGSGGGFSDPSVKALFASGSGKAHENPPFDRDHPIGQLFDVEADPTETVDLWAETPDVVADLYRRLQIICGDESSGLPFDVPLEPR